MFEPAPLLDPYPNALIREDRLFAGVAGRRFLAWAIDSIAIFAVTGLVVILTGFLAVFVLGFVWLGIGFLYRWVGLSRHSATWGMRLVGLTLVNRHESRGNTVAMTVVERNTAFVHTLVYTVSMAFVLPQLLSIGLILLTREHRSLSDILLGTASVNQDALWLS